MSSALNQTDCKIVAERGKSCHATYAWYKRNEVDFFFSSFHYEFRMDDISDVVIFRLLYVSVCVCVSVCVFLGNERKKKRRRSQ